MNWRLDDYNYYNDHRTNARSAYGNFDRKTGRISFCVTIYGECCGENPCIEGCEVDSEEEIMFSLPAHFEVCDICDGRGHYVNPSIDSGGLSQEDFDEDPGFEEDYFRGVYDVSCERCHGKNVIPVVNNTGLTEKEQKLYERYMKRVTDDAAYDAECRAERMMGA